VVVFKLLFRLVVALVVAAAVAAGVGLALFLKRGVSARRQPMRAEEWIARRLRLLAIPKDARELANPVAPTPEVLAQARAHFADHCASCHANDGSGNTEMGLGLYPKPPDMRRPLTQQLSDGALYFIIRNGVRFTGMPAWGDPALEPDPESWALVHFVRHLPRITPAELDEMAELNPRSPQELREQQEIEEFLEGGAASPSPPVSQHHH
jgi:mono/diheme cytochrome c family protein